MTQSEADRINFALRFGILLGSLVETLGVSGYVLIGGGDIHVALLIGVFVTLLACMIEIGARYAGHSLRSESR